MADSPILSEYVAGLGMLLEPPVASYRSGETARPPSPYNDEQIEQAELFLEQSLQLETDLVNQWQEAQDAHERSMAELRLLAAAAADLVIAERLARASGDPEIAGAMYGVAGTAGSESVIFQALNSPDKLIAAGRLPPYRSVGQEAMQLQAAISECLRYVHDETVDVTGDAIAGFLTMDAAILKEAAEALGADISDWLGKTAAGTLKTAVDYVLAASDKLRALLGPRAEEMVREGIYDFIEDIKENELMSQAIERFLDTKGIYRQGRDQILTYQGDPVLLAAVADEIMALQGSFRGRAKVTDAIVKGLAAVKLLKPLAVPPWGPLGVTAAYLTVTGYMLYTAHDHVDSGRYAFLDRVRGVRGTLTAELDNPTLVDPSDQGQFL